MRLKWVLALAMGISVATVGEIAAQDLDPHFRKIKDGIYVHVGDVRVPPDPERDSNAGIIITQDGVVLVDTGETPLEARRLLAAVKKLTTQPVRYVILTEPHPDHYTGSFLFSPPAAIVTQGQSIRSMKNARAGADGARIKGVAELGEEGRAAIEGYRFVVPQIAFENKMTLQVGERTLELMYLKDVHSEGDVAVWLPNERVLFSAGGLVPDQFPVLRPFVNIPDILDAGKMMTALNPEFVIPGHGIPGTVKIFEDSRTYWLLLLDRVAEMVKSGKNVTEIKRDLKLPEYAHFGSKPRFPGNIEAAFNAVCSPRDIYRIYGNDTSKDTLPNSAPCRLRP